MVNPQSIWSREAGIVARRIAGETLLVPVSQRVQEMGLFTLNEVGSFVWERLDGERQLGRVLEEVVAAFEVEAETATADLEAFLGLLARVGCAREVSA